MIEWCYQVILLQFSNFMSFVYPPFSPSSMTIYLSHSLIYKLYTTNIEKKKKKNQWVKKRSIEINLNLWNVLDGIKLKNNKDQIKSLYNRIHHPHQKYTSTVSGYCIHILPIDVRKPYHFWSRAVIEKAEKIGTMNHCLVKQWAKHSEWDIHGY